jgi:hypothetical protein
MFVFFLLVLMSGYSSENEPVDEGARFVVGVSEGDGGYASEEELRHGLVEEGYVSETLEPPPVAIAEESSLAKRRRGRPRKHVPVEVIDEEPISDVPIAQPAAQAPASAVEPDVVLAMGLSFWPAKWQRISDGILDLIRQPEPERFTDSAVGRSLHHIFDKRLPLQGPVLRSSSWRAEAQAANVPGTKAEQIYQSVYFDTAAMVEHVSRMYWSALLGHIIEEIRAGRLHGHLLLLAGQSDEATSKLRTKYEDASSKQLGAAGEPARVVQNELIVGVLVEDKKPNGRLRMITGSLPCHLHTVDRATSETLHATHRVVYETELPGFGPDCRKNFDMTIISHTQDKCSANEKQCKAAGVDAAGRTYLELNLPFRCDIHRTCTVTTAGYSIGNDHVSGCLALAIAERGPGRFTVLRKIIADICRRRLRIVRGHTLAETKPEAFRHRAAFVDLVLPRGGLVEKSGEFRKGGMSRHLRRMAYDKLFNGDIQDVEHIWHHVPVGSPSDADLKEDFVKEAPLLLLPSLLKHFPRHRWTGSQQVFTDVALLANTHGILKEAITLWCDAKGVSAQPAVAALPAAAAAHDEGYMSEDGTEQQLVVASSDVADYHYMAAVQRPNWEKVNKKAKTDVGAWARSDPAAAITVLTLTGQPIARLMEQMLHRSGQKWDHQNDCNVAQGGARKYRVLEAHRNSAELLYGRAAARLLLSSEPWNVIAIRYRKKEFRSMAFRILMRHMGGTYLLMFVPHKGMPFSLFRLIEDESFAVTLVREPICLRDDFTQGLITAKNAEETPSNLVSHVTLSCLTSVAEVVRLDTARIETGHSFWQREAKCRGLQTAVDTFLAVSSTFVMHRTRVAQEQFNRRHVRRILKKRGRPPKVRAPRERKRLTEETARPRIGGLFCETCVACFRCPNACLLRARFSAGLFKEVGTGSPAR